MTEQALFVLIHRPGPEWQSDSPYPEQEGVADHVAHMRSFFDDGRIVLGGPFTDDSGGMVLLEASDLEDATDIASRDPKVVDGLLEVDVHPWRTVFRRD